MNTDGFNSHFLCLFKHCLEMVYVAVNISVRKKSYKMKDGTVFHTVADQFPPYFAFKHLSACNRVIDKFRTLCHHPSASYRIMPHFTVSHI